MNKKKIEYYGTLGPACGDKETLIRMFEAGMTGIRLNLSHRSLKDSEEWVNTYLDAAKTAGKEADLLVDLIGPEIRIGDLAYPLRLKEGEKTVLSWIETAEDEIPVPTFVKEHMKAGQKLLLDDGKIELKVEKAGEGKAICDILRGGMLSSRKSLALPGCVVKNPPLTPQDHENLKNAKAYGVTAVMQPFARGKEDLITLRNALKEYGGEHIRIFAKIENLEGVEKLEELIPYSDVIVIARGDLGNAVPLPYLPVLQQKITKVCNEQGKPFMVVTQMLNSMIESQVPTRAEVNDIFHALNDGASSVMLTGETAAGKYPVEAMRVLVETGEHALAYER